MITFLLYKHFMNHMCTDLMKAFILTPITVILDLLFILFQPLYIIVYFNND